jgi:hypothetical protein
MESSAGTSYRVYVFEHGAGPSIIICFMIGKQVCTFAK